MLASTSSAWSCARETRRPTPAPAGRCARRSGSWRSASARGYGHAILCGREFVGDQPFLHLVGDHLPVAQGTTSCARQLVDVAVAESAPVSAVQPTRESHLTSYGAVGGQLVGGEPGALPDRHGAREAHADRRRAAADRAGAARRLLPVLLRNARPRAGDPGTARRAARGRAGRRARAVAGAARARVAPAIPRLVDRRSALRHRRALRPPVRAAGAVALRPRPGPRAHAARRAARRQRPTDHEPARSSTWSSQPTRPRETGPSNGGAGAGRSAELLSAADALDALPPPRDEPLQARPRAVLPGGDPPLPPAARARSSRGWAACPTTASATSSSGASRRPSRSLPPRSEPRGPERDALQRPGRRLPALWRSRRSPTRCAAACARCAATSGCSASAIPPTSRCACGPSCSRRDAGDAPYPILRERTPVRMDLTHCGWSDIFFLGMDFPEGARVLNVSIDLGVRGRDAAPRPPVEAYLRVIDEPVLRLASVDLERHGRRRDARRGLRLRPSDYLGLLKAAVIAAGIVPPGIEGSGAEPRATCSARVVGPGRGLELVSQVNDIPEGLAAGRLDQPARRRSSACCMRATGQIRVAHRAAGGGRAPHGRGPGHPRRVARRLRRRLAGLRRRLAGHQADRGRRWPARRSRVRHQPRPPAAAPHAARPRSRLRRRARRAPGLARARPRRHGAERRPDPRDGDREVPAALRARSGRRASEAVGDARRDPRRRCAAATSARSARAHHRATSSARSRPSSRGRATATPRRSSTRTRAAFGDDFWGFWMLGGMSGGGMGFIFAPQRRAEGARRARTRSCSPTKRELGHALPFAMEPVVYDFAINEQRHGGRRCSPARTRCCRSGYYQHAVPGLLRREPRDLSPPRARATSSSSRARRRTRPGVCRRRCRRSSTRCCPPTTAAERADRRLDDLLDENGFDRAQHEQIRADLRAGRIGLAQNRLPATHGDRGRARRRTWPTSAAARRATTPAPGRRGGAARAARSPWSPTPPAWAAAGRRAPAWSRRCIRSPSSRGRHRTFIEVHLAKTPADGARVRRRRAARLHHQLPDARADRALPARRAGDCGYDRTVFALARPVDRPAARAHGRATCASPGRRCRSRCSTSSSRRCATACAPR